MHHKKSRGTSIVLFFLVFIFAGCTTRPQQLRKMLLESPDIVFDVLENNPDRFQALLKKMNANSVLPKDEKAAGNGTEAPKVAAENRPLQGRSTAAIKMVVYSDFQCPYCRNGFVTVEELKKKYGDKIAVTFKHFPLDFHPLALPAAKRYEAILLQSKEKAFQFHDLVFTEQRETMAKGETGLDEAAKKVGADVEKMKRQMESETIAKRIRADTEEAKGMGIGGTPGFNINGVIVKGARPLPDFEQVIDGLLAQKSK